MRTDVRVEGSSKDTGEVQTYSVVRRDSVGRVV